MKKIYILIHPILTYCLIYFIIQAVKTVEGDRLVLTNVQRTDMGGYLCIASNGIPPSVSKRFDVHVNCKYQINSVIYMIHLQWIGIYVEQLMYGHSNN